MEGNEKTVDENIKGGGSIEKESSSEKSEETQKEKISEPRDEGVVPKRKRGRPSGKKNFSSKNNKIATTGEGNSEASSSDREDLDPVDDKEGVIQELKKNENNRPVQEKILTPEIGKKIMRCYPCGYSFKRAIQEDFSYCDKCSRGVSVELSDPNKF